jgi:hypothetical protein
LALWLVRWNWCLCKLIWLYDSYML